MSCDLLSGTRFAHFDRLNHERNVGMVAVFTGLGAGFERGSAAQLGSNGLLGSGLQGRGGDNISVNAATGNLLITRQDEFLVGRGPDIGIARTYNSLGALDENGDHWRQSTDRRVYGLTGSVNTNGSTVKRVGADGSEVTYTYHSTYKGMDINGNIITGSYRATDGSGAHNSLVYASGKWTWNDGDSGIREVYFGTGGYIQEQIDRDGDKLTFTYSSGKLTKITADDGGYVQYVWSGNKITRMDTYANGAGTSRTHIRTRYGYDGSGRLTSVTTDLTLNSSISDGKTYVTNYTYDGSSKRIASITQTDGSQVNFTYDSSGRIYNITQIPGNGEPNRFTQVRYINSTRTDVYDPSGTRTILYYDGNKQLTRQRLYMPNNGFDYSAYYTYDSSGNVKTVQDAEGNLTTFNYDTRGNVTQQVDPAGNSTYFVYNDRNDVTRIQKLGSQDNSSNAWQYVRYVYDGAGRLRYEISAEGHVTEYRYEGGSGSIYGQNGDLRYTLKYTTQAYPIGSTVPTESQMNTWRNGFDKSHATIFEHRYDAKGNVMGTVDWSNTTSSGGLTAGEGYTHTLYTHDSAGRILTKRIAGLATESFAYDGLGRTISTTDLNGGTTTVTFNDAATTTVITSAGGSVTTNTYNKAGNLISSMTSGSHVNSGTVSYKHDKNGRVRIVTSATGGKTYFVYDKAGNLTAEVDHSGFVQEFRYDKNGRQIAHARYTRYKASADRTAMLATLADPNNTLTAVDLRYSTDQATNHHSYDIWQWTAYDSKGQVSRTVLGDGSVTAYTYDNGGRLVKTHTYVNKLSSSQLTNLRAGTVDADAYLPTANSAKDRIIRTFYDRDGRVVGTLDGEGYLTKSTYDQAGRLIQESAYANLTSTTYRASGTYTQLFNSVTKSSTKDAHTRYVYDGQGLLRFTIDARGKVTENIYKGSGNSNTFGVVRQVIQHTATLGSLSNYNLSTVKAAVAALGSTGTNRSSWAVYNTRSQLMYAIDATGAVTGFKYDAMGNVTKTTQYAATRATTSLPSESTMNSWAGSNSANARITRSYYNTAGQLRFTIDAEGYVTRIDYDKNGRKYDVFRFDQKVSATDSWTIDTVNSQRNTSNSAYVRTAYRYQANGALSSVYDGLNTRHYIGYYANGEQAWDIRAYGHGEDESRVYVINDAAGRRYRTIRFSENYSQGWAESKPNDTRLFYDGLGNLTREQKTRYYHDTTTVDQNTYFEYDRAGNVTKQTNAEGGITLLEYNAFGQVTKTTDPLGNITTNTYDKAGQLTRTTDALGHQTDFTYTAFGEQSTITRNNATTTFYYDNLGRVKQVKDALNKSEYFTHDAFGNRTQYKNKLGGITNYTYDKRGMLIQEQVMANVYNSSGSLLSSNIINKFEYDSRGNRTKSIEGFGRTEQRTTTFVYDKADRLIQKKGDAVQVYINGTDSSVATVTPTEYFTYDRRGNLIESKDANGGLTLYYYDKLDRITHQVSPEGTLVRNFYDANSNLIETRIYDAKPSPLPTNATGTPPAGAGSYRRTTFTYDRLNRMTNSYVHDVQTAKFTTSLSITGTGNDLRTQYFYDANGNVTRVIDPNGNSTFSYYDKLGRKTYQVDAGGYLTQWLYDADNNVTRERRFVSKPTGTPSTSSYGTIVYNWNNGDRITDFTYDKNGNRLTEKRMVVAVHNGSGAHTNQTVTISYTYNALGQVTRKTEATGDYINYQYDNQGRLNYETRSAYVDHLGGSVSPKVQYLYNALNDVSRVYKYGKNGSISHTDSHYTYAQGGRLTSVTDGNGFVRTYRYDAKGQMVREEYARVTNSGTKTEGIGYEFDKEGRVIAQGAVWLNGSTWTRSGLDVINTKYNTFGDVIERGINGKYSEKMAYDKAGRLWRTNSGDGAYKYFMYDNNGNQTLVLTSDGTNIDNTSIATVIGKWGVSASGGNANNIWTNYVDGVTATITKFDARNLAVEVREPERQIKASTRHDLITKRTYNAFGEVLSETDANNNTINYTYNAMGRRIKVESPEITVYGEDGTVITDAEYGHGASGDANKIRPTEHYYYDQSGRLVASRDANGNLTRQTLLAGTGYNGTQALVTKVENVLSNGAVYATATTAYDIQGNARKTTDQIGRVTTNSFDKMGRLTQTNHANGLVNYHSYDGLGQQIKAWNSVYGSTNANQTDYDAQGRVISQRAIGGDVTTYAYSWNTSSGNGLSTYGGWQETTTLANGRSQSSYKDVFGRVTKTTNLSNQYTNYTYDKGGRLTQVSGTGADTQNYYYLNTGNVDRQVITGSNYDYSHFSANSFSLTTTYGYDKVGNLTSEQLKETSTVEIVEYSYEDMWGGVEIFEYTYTVTTNETLKNAVATYDELGRLKSWQELGTPAQTGYVSNVPAASKSFEYDAQGNIRKTTSSFYTLNSAGEKSAAQTVKTSWYLYDALNRVTTAEGQLTNGQIVRGTTGTDLAYDAAGQRVYSIKDTVSYFYDKNTGTTTTTTTANRENFTYNTAGQVTQVRTTSTIDGTMPAAGGTLRAALVYDLLGRQTRQYDYNAAGTAAVFDSAKTYNAKGQLINDTSITQRSDGTFKTITYFNYGAGSSYALGAALTVNTSHYKNNVYENSSRTTNTYSWLSGAVLNKTIQDFNTGSTSDPLTTTNYANSKNGTLVSARIADGRARTVTFTIDGNGQTIRRDEEDNKTDTGDPHEIWYRFGGKEMGYVGNNGSTNTDYATSINDRTTTPTTGTNAGAFRHGRTTGVSYTDFDQAFDKINSYKQGSAAGQYSVQSGDTLQSIAGRVYGDSSLWFKIAQANGMSGQETLVQGQALTLPAGVMKTAHNTNTFKPFNPGETIGDLNPTTPIPQTPKKKKCGVLGAILLVVVAVVVTVVTAGAALAAVGAAANVGAGIGTVMAGGVAGALGGGVAGAVGAVAIGAGAAAVGSIASQAVGVATGIQEKFSWKNVALAAIGGGVTAGLGAGGFFGEAGLGGAGTAGAAIRAAAGSAISQGIGVATGLQEKFSWASVAAAGAGAAFGAQFGGAIAGKVGEATGSKFLGKLASNSASAIAGAAARSLVEGTSFGDNVLDALPSVIGSTIGNALAEEIGKSLLVPKVASNEVTATGQVADSAESQEAIDEIVVTGTKNSGKDDPLTDDERSYLKQRKNQELELDKEIADLEADLVRWSERLANGKKKTGFLGRDLTDAIPEDQTKLVELRQRRQKTIDLHDRVMEWAVGETVQLKVNGTKVDYVIRGPGVEFDTLQEAARDGIAMGFLLKKTVGDDYERGGTIIETSNGKFMYERIVTGALLSYDYNGVEAGTPLVPTLKITSNTRGHFHLHPNKDEHSVDNDDFSPGDITSFRGLSSTNVTFFLGGADGSFDALHYDANASRNYRYETIQGAGYFDD